jgi:hypothetical protein
MPARLLLMWFNTAENRRQRVTRRQRRDLFSAPGVEALATVRRGFFMRGGPRFHA